MVIPAKKGEIVVAPAQSTPATVPSIADNLLPMLREILTNPAISPERVTQTLDFYERMDRLQGKKEFDAALANAKAKFDPIVKRHKVEYGEGTRKTSYKHEDLFDVLAAVQPALSEEGVIVRYRATSNINEPIRVTCIVSHRSGYSEETTLTAGADSTGGKNTIQQIGSTLTYLQRYTLRLALGLAAGRDDDGQAAGLATKPDSECVSAEQAEAIKKKILEVGANVEAFLKLGEVESISDIPASQYQRVMDLLNAKKKAKK